MHTTLINPETLGAPKGYANGILVDTGGKLLFIAGQIGWNAEHQIVGDDLVEQFSQALSNVLAVVNHAGGKPDDIVRLTLYVTDKAEYARRTSEIGTRYRELMGKHFPAMALIEVKGLLNDAAKVEIEGTAVIF
jgi:enamine deaminase RidA (YjgF/YER057c/UK114 family)